MNAPNRLEATPGRHSCSYSCATCPACLGRAVSVKRMTRDQFIQNRNRDRNAAAVGALIWVVLFCGPVGLMAWLEPERGQLSQQLPAPTSSRRCQVVLRSPAFQSLPRPISLGVLCASACVIV